jgi:hypothetical protein
MAPLLLAVAGCGNSVSSTPSPRPTASPTPTSGPPLLVVADPSDYAFAGAITVRFYWLDGTEVSHVMLPASTQVVAARGARVFVLSNGKLRGLHRDGSFEELADLGKSGGGVTPSPDGTRWLWSTDVSNAGSSTITSAIHLAGDGLKDRVIITNTEGAHVLRPYEWTNVGAFLAHTVQGIGAYVPFGLPLGPVDRLNVETATATPIANSDTCQFSDMSADGTIACFPSHSTVRLAYPDGHVTDIPLSTPRFESSGDAFFSLDGRHLTVAGASGKVPDSICPGCTGGPASRWATDLITTSDGSITRLALDDVRPADTPLAACWLPYDALIVYRPTGSVDSPGVFEVGSSGAITPISKSGVPVGVLTE